MIYPDTIDILQETETPDGSGGFDTSTTTRYSDVPCNFTKRSEISTQRKREIMGDTAEINYDYVVQMSSNYSDFAEDDIIQYNGTDYKITGSDEGRLQVYLTLKEK